MSTSPKHVADGQIEQVDQPHRGNEWADEKHQLDHEHARQLATEYDPNSPEEKKLVRKLDWRLVVGLTRSLYSSHR